MLEGFAKAGDNFAKSFQVFATYPFIDEAVGRSPQVARNLHMGDYTNLSVNLDINSDLLAPVCGELEAVLDVIQKAVNDAADQCRARGIGQPAHHTAERRALRKPSSSSLLNPRSPRPRTV